jgi:hypothetical protein
MRQLGLALAQYAHQSKDFVPLGYQQGPGAILQKQWNYLAVYNRTGVPAVTQLGLLWASGLLPQAKAYYCPSETYFQFVFNGENNPWPPLAPGVGPFNDSRLGYGTRPTVAWPTPADVILGKLPKPFDRLVRLKSKAIVADIICFPASLDSRHKKGINVLYGHGGAHWVDRSVLQNATVPGAITWRSIPFDTFSSTYNDGILKEIGGGLPDKGVWGELDNN